MNVDGRIYVAVDRFLSQPVEISIQMNPGTCGNVNAKDLIRMTQVWHVCLRSMLPRNRNYVIACKHQILHLNVGVARKLYSTLGSEINLVCVLSFIPVNFTHMELGQSFAGPRFAALNFMDFLSSLMPSFFQNDSIYSSSSAELRTQPGHPLASVFNFNNVFM